MDRQEQRRYQKEKERGQEKKGQKAYEYETLPETSTSNSPFHRRRSRCRTPSREADTASPGQRIVSLSASVPR